MTRFVMLFTLFLGALAAPASTPSLPDSLSRPGRLDASISQETRAALDRGLTWLATQQKASGGWSGEDRPDLTALPLLAFAASPDPAHRAITERGSAFLFKAASTSSTPAIVFTAMLLTRESGAIPEYKTLLPRIRDRLNALPLPLDPKLLAWRLSALRGMPDPPSMVLSTQVLARTAIDSRSASAAVLLGMQAAGAARNDPVLWKAFAWIARHPDVFSPSPLTGETYEDLLLLALALAQAGENRLPLADGSLLAWRPLLARTLINAQRVDPKSGGLYWLPSDGGTPKDALTASSYALLILQLVLAE